MRKVLWHRVVSSRFLSRDDLWTNVYGRSGRNRSRYVQTAEIRIQAASKSAAGPLKDWCQRPDRPLWAEGV
jgi:hypothetical protein